MFKLYLYTFMSYKIIHEYTEIISYLISAGKSVKYIFEFISGVNNKKIDSEKYRDWILIMDEPEREF